jgi:hypothetical protein
LRLFVFVGQFGVWSMWIVLFIVCELLVISAKMSFVLIFIPCLLSIPCALCLQRTAQHYRCTTLNPGKINTNCFLRTAQARNVTLVYTFNFLLIMHTEVFRGAQTSFQVWKHIKILLVMNSFTFNDVISHLIMSS